ncbi:hypothetical protein Asp14428_05560 [Actinoplanes sp. NBRC 14428]|uniref:Small secreted domain DUF320 n=1 Tax=Pseudosporangium ferrugineum TaxID=439699 RepID=A0A2T0SHQ6_9ACTN|nr:chaplin family protein [Pseudosporangium ferrugineum]PRY32954.1 small secreted domain DUF320 [Pseudosporangium ferrugineum]BCJ49081.1 hypothetical protein Asp14428_05560 [Actinoplanes sp. NBRC 14428]
MKLVKGLLLGAGTVAAALVLTAGPASAYGHDDDGDTNVGVLNGNSVVVPVHIPVNVCGNAIAVLGIAGAGAICGNG